MLPAMAIRHHATQAAPKIMTQTNTQLKNIQLDNDQQVAFNEIKDNPNKNFFIQGQAGTGKSTLINCIRSEFKKWGREVAVVAPTGIAAELINGSTIHSMFKLGPQPYFPNDVYEEYKLYDEIVKVIKTLIIDEASMLRADVFDTINYLCQKAKNNFNLTFGGIQIILVGDLYQLPPVYVYDKDESKKLKSEEYIYMTKTYGTEKPFFFDALCFGVGEFKMLKLRTVHRQGDDTTFRKNLEAISIYNRAGNADKVEKALSSLNKRYDRDARQSALNEDIPIVTSRNNEAIAININKLSEIQQKAKVYNGVFSGEYYEKDKDGERKKKVIVPEHLELKVGAKVMICCNDACNRYVNGTIGRVSRLEEDYINVNVRGTDVEIRRNTWEEKEYQISNNGNMVLNTIGKYEQFPLKLAYAITIHKSQGQTWHDVCIDLGSKNAFAPGQIYVALSRVKKQEGVHLVRELTLNDIRTDERVRQFLETGKKPLVEERNTKHISLEDRKKGNFMRSFWKDYCDCYPNVVYSKLLTVKKNSTKRRVYSSCFWSTLPFELLNEPLNLIYNDINEETSYLFKIPANDIKICQVAAKEDIYTLDPLQKYYSKERSRWIQIDRHDEWDAFKEVFFDLFIECGCDFTELNKREVHFKDYLVASETNGVVTLYSNNDDLS